MLPVRVRPLVLLDVDGVLNALPPPGRPVPWADWRTGFAQSRVGTFRISWSPAVVAAVTSWRELADVQWLTTWGHEANGSLRELLELPELPVAGSHEDSPEDTPEDATDGEAPDAGGPPDGDPAAGDADVGDPSDPVTGVRAAGDAEAGDPTDPLADGAAGPATSPQGGDDAGPPRPAAAHAAVAPAAPDRLTGRWWKFDVVRRHVRADPGRPVVWIDDDLAGQSDVQEWMRQSTTCLLVAPSLASGLTADHLHEVEAFLRRFE